MDLKLFFSTFGLIFLAELGDKTQIATLIRASETKEKLSVFFGSAGALITASLLAVLLGHGLYRFLPPNYIKIAGGTLFIIIGVWMLFFSRAH